MCKGVMCSVWGLMCSVCRGVMCSVGVCDVGRGWKRQAIIFLVIDQFVA